MLRLSSSSSLSSSAFVYSRLVCLVSLSILLLLSASTDAAFSAPVTAPNQQQQKVQKNAASTTTTTTTLISDGADKKSKDAWVTADAFIANNGKQQDNTKDTTAITITTSSSISSSLEYSSFSSGPVIGGPARALIYDTTLRDGTQGESISASVDDKLKICRRLVAFGVDYVEAGWPGSNPKDAAFFERSKNGELSTLERSKLSAFGSTRRKNIKVQDDAQVQALLNSQAPTICIVAKCHAWQVTDILQATLDENLNMIRDTVSYLCSAPYNRNVMVDMEHALDGYEYDAEYALQCCRTAAAAGASCVVLCDTNGGSMPWQVEKCVRAVVDAVAVINNNNNEIDNDNDNNNNSNSEDDNQKRKTVVATSVGIHCHNDAGMAVANSIVAISAGAGIVQGTINGIGERTGNADLCSIIPSLALKCQTQMSCRDNLSQLTSLSRYIDEILNRSPNMAAPYVGASAFAHKGGLHVAAMARSSKSYQHVEPKDVGNESRVLISELAGRQNIMGKFAALGIDADVASEKAVFLLKRIKQLEALGYTFEGAEASVHLMMLHASDGYCQQFRVLDYAVNVQDTHIDSASRFLKSATEQGGNSGSMARATVKVRTHRVVPNAKDGSDNDDTEDLYQERLEVGEGNGPVNALANALMKALEPVHPTLKSVELNDYKVRILNPDSATGAAVRVMIEFRDTRRDKTWTTVSADTNVISASFNALIDGLEYALLDDAEICMLDEIPG